MELDEMKSKWQQYDKVLQQNKMLNEKIVNMMLKDKSKNAIRNILNFEYSGLVVCCILLMIYLLQFKTAFDSTLMTVSYFISLALVATCFVTFYYKHKMLTSLDFNMNNLTQTADTIERFRLFITKERLATLILSPVIIVSTVVVFVRWLLRMDVLELPDIFLPRMIIGSVVMIIAQLLLYKYLYFDTIKNIKANLAEIEKFRSEVMQ